MNIFEISSRLQHAYEMAESGDYSPEAVADTLEAIEWELSQKADDYVNLIALIKGEIDVIKSETERLSNLRKSKENFIAQLKDSLYNAMKLSENSKFKTPLHSYWIQLNPPSVSILDEAKIPSEYYTTPEPVLSKSLIQESLKSGIEVPGAELTQGEGVRWK